METKMGDKNNYSEEIHMNTEAPKIEVLIDGVPLDMGDEGDAILIFALKNDMECGCGAEVCAGTRSLRAFKRGPMHPVEMNVVKMLIDDIEGRGDDIDVEKFSVREVIQAKMMEAGERLARSMMGKEGRASFTAIPIGEAEAGSLREIIEKVFGMRDDDDDEQEASCDIKA